MSDMGNAGFRVEAIKGGALFTIDRPEKLNALTRPVVDGLSSCLDQLEREGERLLVITGAGARAFCAGTDLAEMQGLPMDARLAKNAMVRALLVRMSRSSLISVAAINGLALGGGLEVAMACTLRIAVADAQLGLPEVKLGLLPAYAGTQFLPAIAGRALAEDLMLTGRNIGAEEALARGLIHRIVPAGTDAVAAAVALGQEVVCHSPVAVAAIRACMDAAGPQVSDAGLAVEDSYVRSVFAGPEAEAGVEAFLARRKRN